MKQAIEDRKKELTDQKTLKDPQTRRNPGRMDGVQWNGSSFVCVSNVDGNEARSTSIVNDHDAPVQASYEDIVSHIDVSDSTSRGAMVVSLMDIARPAKVKGTFKISRPCIH
jgi:hypothetical protein